MAHLLQSLQEYFVFDVINIDNWTFKLFYKVVPPCVPWSR